MSVIQATFSGLPTATDTWQQDKKWTTPVYYPICELIRTFWTYLLYADLFLIYYLESHACLLSMLSLNYLEILMPSSIADKCLCYSSRKLDHLHGWNRFRGRVRTLMLGSISVLSFITEMHGAIVLEEVYCIHICRIHCIHTWNVQECIPTSAFCFPVQDSWPACVVPGACCRLRICDINLSMSCLSHRPWSYFTKQHKR